MQHMTESPVAVQVTPKMIRTLSEAHDTAIHNVMKARIPECADFGGIAQDMGWFLSEIEQQIATGMPWQAFNGQHLNGHYWACGTHLDEEGVSAPFVSLVSVKTEKEGGEYLMAVDPVSPEVTGDFDGSYTITHVMAYEPPVTPKL